MFDSSLSAQVGLVIIGSQALTGIPQSFLGPNGQPFVVGPTGAKVNSVTVLNNAGQVTAVAASLWILRNGTAYNISTCGIQGESGAGGNSVPIPNVLLNASFGPVPPFVGLPTDSNGNAFILLGPGDILQIAIGNTITTPFTCYAMFTQ
jgi:hypothetical protein